MLHFFALIASLVVIFIILRVRVKSLFIAGSSGAKLHYLPHLAVTSSVLGVLFYYMFFYIFKIPLYNQTVFLGACCLLALCGIFFIFQGPKIQFIRKRFERIIKLTMLLCATVAFLVTIGIILSLFSETIRFFSMYPINDFLFGTKWSPQVAIREDQAGASGAFGLIPLLWGSLLVTFIALSVAIPVGLFTAIYLSEYANKKTRKFAKPILEILSGIPTVVYGFLAVTAVAPFIRDIGVSLGLQTTSESALAVGLVIGVMIIPYLSSLSDDVLNAVPQNLRDAAYALGSTKAEVIQHIVIKEATPGIISAFILAFSRAIGETMVVVMAAGTSANLTFNPLDTVTTITVQIATLLVGDQEFNSVKTLSAFALGFMLFILTLALNFYAVYIISRYRKKYT